MKGLLNLKRLVPPATSVLLLVMAYSKITYGESMPGYVIKIDPNTNLDLTLNHNSDFYIDLISDRSITANSKSKYFHSNGGIFFSDKDCKLGHSVQIRFDNNRKQLQSVYLKNELAWDQAVHLKIISEEYSNKIKLKFNDEEISFNPKTRPKYLYISSKYGKLKVETSSLKINIKE